MTTPAPAADPAPADDEPAGWRWTPTRVLLTCIALALVAMWGYVLYLAFGPGRQPPIDRLDDPAFARAAEIRCAEALELVEGLPVANASPTAVRPGRRARRGPTPPTPPCSTTSTA